MSRYQRTCFIGNIGLDTQDELQRISSKVLLQSPLLVKTRQRSTFVSSVSVSLFPAHHLLLPIYLRFSESPPSYIETETPKIQ